MEEEVAMEKPAHAEAELHELIRRRWSPRAFADRPVEPAKLHTLFEAARWAPSCYNEQPWSFLVATKEQQTAYDEIFASLVPGNQAWAGTAPVLAISVAKRHFEKNGKPNPHYWHDVGLAMGNLCLQATDLGLFVHQMMGFSADRVRQSFSVPEGHEPVAAIAIGYAGDPAMLPDGLREREVAPRERRPMESFVFCETWGSTAPFVKTV
jgi:nitroreductase